MRVYITDLEAYNNGHLVGQWYQLPIDDNLLAESKVIKMTQNTKNNPKKYLGWKNKATWNVMLHLNNDGYIDCFKSNLEYELNNIDIVKPIVTDIGTYEQFIKYFNLQDTQTMDGVKYLDDTLDYEGLNEFISELGADYHAV